MLSIKQTIGIYNISVARRDNKYLINISVRGESLPYIMVLSEIEMALLLKFLELSQAITDEPTGV